jgi:hypothetical protein
VMVDLVGAEAEEEVAGGLAVEVEEEGEAAGD